MPMNMGPRRTRPSVSRPAPRPMRPTPRPMRPTPRPMPAAQPRPSRPTMGGLKKGGKMELPKKKPRHANPRHPMNAERTTGDPRGVNRKKAGGKLKMVEKNGKKVPFYAADGVGKMAEGGKAKKMAKSAMNMVKKYGKKAAESGALGPTVQGLSKVPEGLKTLKKVYDRLPEPKGAKKSKKKEIAAKSGGSMKIKSGDTLSQIAKSKGISLKALLAANPSIKNANKIRVGQSIKIPGAEAGKAAKTSNPYKGMSRVQMADMDVKNKSEKRQRTATRSMQTQAKMGSGMTPTPSKAKATMEKKSGREAMLKKARALRDKKIAASKKMGGGSMKKAQGYKHGGKMCRGGGAATRGKSYSKAG